MSGLDTAGLLIVLVLLMVAIVPTRKVDDTKSKQVSNKRKRGIKNKQIPPYAKKTSAQWRTYKLSQKRAKQEINAMWDEYLRGREQ